MINPPTPWLAPVPSKPVRFDYKGTNMIKVPLGSFNCYKLEGPSVYGNVPLYYDVNSKLLIYLYGKLELLVGKLEGKLSLKETNVKLTPQRCLIATATYDSELSPEVQFLRDFRDNVVLSSFAGGSFMQAFNAWYYSFSPSVAEFISEHSTAKAVSRAALYPLVRILHLSSEVYSAFGSNAEMAVIVTGLIASSLIGVAYLLPIIILLTFSAGKRAGSRSLRSMFTSQPTN
jgi:hypothetical protein